MFQTEIIIFFQSFANDFVTSLFTFFTEIGRGTYAAPLLLTVMFGISFRMGFILLHAVSWNGLLTFWLKNLFSLPRPANVDVHVRLLGETLPNPTPFENGGAESFFGGFSSDVVEYIRQYPFDSWGFPSGHASHAVALWGSISLYVKKKWLYLLALMMIVFISLSRMYLGRHFLADILGGLLLGAVVTWIFYWGVYQNTSLRISVFEKGIHSQGKIKSILLFSYFLIVPLLVWFIPGIPKEQAAILLGLNIGFLVLRHSGLPQDSGSLLQRFGRVILAGAVFFLLYAGLKRGVGLILSNEPAVVEFIRQVLTMTVSLWTSVNICVRLGLYRR